ncbi:MAG TPA: hypothetical protein VKX25_17225 [Bryobacteraceae bacterium]|jgi:hypothetical protein|nr:hypothetical protein [Bryobacteraceae bacterium]
MAAALEPLLMTVEEYRRLPNREDCIEELHWGQPVQLSHPKSRHIKLQLRLRDLLGRQLGKFGIVGTEIPFRALPEYELRGADVLSSVKNAGTKFRTTTISTAPQSS